MSASRLPGLLGIAGLLCLFCGTADAAPPNIVIILSDDMGFSDLGCYGGEINTPNLDKLAGGGLRFTQFYNTARCCPTRASLLTGLYPHQAGVGHMTQDQGSDSYRGDLNNRSITIAEALRPVGYRSYAVGKWHVTKHIQPDGPRHNWPLQRGFDRYYGIITGGGTFYDPPTLTRDNTMLTAFNDPEYKPTQYYLTDAISDHAVRYISSHAQEHGEKPFFLYVAYTAAHWPMHALPEDMARYRGKYDAGYDSIRKARLGKAAGLGLIDPVQGLTPAAEEWSTVPDKKWEAACMETYAAMVDRMDQGIGKIVAELNRTGRFDNTLIFYLQDNGGCAEGMGRTKNKTHPDGPRAEKPSLPTIPNERILTAVVPTQTRDGFPVRQGPNVMPGPADTYIAYGRGWANASNTPFREYKHWVHEGGISTPLIAHWPAGIPNPRRGELVRDAGHLIDLMATCVDVAGVTYPARFKDQAILPPEGISLRPAFSGTPLVRSQPLYWEHEGNRAIRAGKWKLVSKHRQPWELFDISKDRTEMNDLSRTHPEKVAELASQWEAWATRAGVRPWEEVTAPRKAGQSGK